MDSQTIAAERDKLGEQQAQAQRALAELEQKRSGFAFGKAAGVAEAVPRLAEVERALDVERKRLTDLEAAIRGAEAAEARARADEEAARQAATRKRAQKLADARAPLAGAFDEAIGRAVEAAEALLANGAELGEVLHELGESRGYAAETRQDLEAALGWRFAQSGLRCADAVHEKRRKPLAERDADLLGSFGMKGGA